MADIHRFADELGPAKIIHVYEPSVDLRAVLMVDNVAAGLPHGGGKVVHTKVPHPRLPVEEYLKTQGRFAHLFHPQRNQALIQEIQNMVDAYWATVG